MLIRFDVPSVLPTNALVQAAFLRLVVAREPAGRGSLAVRVTPGAGAMVGG